MALTRERIQEIENHLLARVAKLHPGWLAYVRILIRKAIKEWANNAPTPIPDDRDYDDLQPAAKLALRNALKNAVQDATAQAEVDELVT